MTTETWLQYATPLLEKAGIATARLDCLVLLEDVLNTNRTQLLAHPEHELTDENTTILNIELQKRAQHIPLAYIRGKTEFYSREFYVDERVLEPRPESETMIDILKTIRLSEPSRIADVGTGSGALGITALLELPAATVDLIDLDDGALKVAQTNVDQYKLAARLIQSDLLGATDHAYDVLLCNLPYVPDGFHINRAATHEPDLALFGGPDGLDVYRKLFAQLQGLEKPPVHVLTEAMPPQHGGLTEIALSHGYKQAKSEDFIQHFVRGGV